MYYALTADDQKSIANFALFELSYYGMTLTVMEMYFITHCGNDVQKTVKRARSILF